METGALKRNGPTGGRAKGIPNHLSVPLERFRPRKVPEVRRSGRGPEAAAAVSTDRGSKRKQTRDGIWFIFRITGGE